ncbi:unnamed protein product, partial [Mesorhabditis spiculigera]
MILYVNLRRPPSSTSSRRRGWRKSPNSRHADATRPSPPENTPQIQQTSASAIEDNDDPNRAASSTHELYQLQHCRSQGPHRGSDLPDGKFDKEDEVRLPRARSREDEQAEPLSWKLQTSVVEELITPRPGRLPTAWRTTVYGERFHRDSGPLVAGFANGVFVLLDSSRRCR